MFVVHEPRVGVQFNDIVRNWEEEVKCGHPRTCHMIYFLLAAPATRVQVHKFCLLCFNLGKIIIVLYNPMATVVSGSVFPRRLPSFS